MKIGPLFKNFGSKWQSAKRYPAPIAGLPLFEPYAGGAGYSLNYVDYEVTIWETDKHLFNLWFWLINKLTPAMILDIPLNLPEGTDIKSLGLNEGQSLLLKHWQRTNNYGNCWTISSWGSLSGQWTKNTRARVADQVGAVTHWDLQPPTYKVQGSYFIDPPYQFNFRYGCRDFDHDQIRNDINAVPKGSLVVACEAACPKTGRVPDYLPFVPNHTSVTSRRKTTQNHHSRELIYVRQ